MNISSKIEWDRLKSLSIGGCILIIISLHFFPHTFSSSSVLISVIFISLFGIPHGALDFRLIRILWPEKQVVSVLFGYITLTIFTIFFWTQIPQIMLATFLVMSAFHFGGDYPINFSQRIISGFIILGLPTIFSPNDVLVIFDILNQNSKNDILVEAIQFVTLIGGIYLACLLLFRRISGRQILELLVLVFLAKVCDPLAYFTAYFCLFHSLKHFSEISYLFDHASLMRLFYWSIPITVITLVLGFISFKLLSNITQGPIETSLIQVVFIGLSALTVPHMVFVEWIRIRHKDN